MRIRQILKMTVMLAVIILPFAIASNAFANAAFRGGPVIHEVLTGKAFPQGVIGYPIQLDLYHYSGQQNFSGNFTEKKHNPSVSTVSGSQGKAEFAPGYYIEFTIDSVQSGTACLHCRYTGQFIDNSAMKQARGYWYNPSGQQLGSFYLNA